MTFKLLADDTFYLRLQQAFKLHGAPLLIQDDKGQQHTVRTNDILAVSKQIADIFNGGAHWVTLIY